MRLIRTLLIVLLALATLPAAASAGTLSVQAGVLTYSETDVNAKNNVTITTSTDGSRFNVTDRGTSLGRSIPLKSDGSCTVSRTGGSCPSAGVVSIVVNTGDQDDTITQSSSVPARLDGGNGNDKITGGPANDVLIGEAGADTLIGGGGLDTADYSARVNPVTVTLDGTANDGEAGENDMVGADVEIVAGGAGNDTLTGNDGDNVLLGNGGNDTLTGGGGNDQLDGGAGDDLLDGGTGTDAVTGGDGTDTASYADSPAGVLVVLDGKAGDGAPGENDSIETENVIGSPGDDVLIGNAGPNALSGGDGNDRLLGGKGVDQLDGGAGDDIIQSLDGLREQVTCGDGLDGVVSDKRDVRAGCEYIKYRALSATATALHMSRGAVRVPLRCSPATVEGCHGRITLEVGRRKLGTVAYTWPWGRRAAARVKLGRRAAALLRRRPLTKVQMVVRDVDAAGVATTTRQTLRIARS